MVLLDVIDLEYVLETVRGNGREIESMTRDNGAHVTSAALLYIRKLIATSCLGAENEVDKGRRSVLDADAHANASRVVHG